MKITTLLKAGSLAMEIYNNKSTRQLGSIVRGGLERRGHLPGQGGAMRSSQEEATSVTPPARSPATQKRGLQQWPYRQQPPEMAPYNPIVPLKKAIKHVTPDNMQKAMQWHGIIKSFIAKE